MASEFETEEQEASYTAWLKAKPERSQNNMLPRIPHDQVMVKVRALLEAKKNTSASSRA
ncbi:MAG: antitoxin [Betaproteobacteria bacterium]